MLKNRTVQMPFEPKGVVQIDATVIIGVLFFFDIGLDIERQRRNRKQLIFITALPRRRDYITLNKVPYWLRLLCQLPQWKGFGCFIYW